MKYNKNYRPKKKKAAKKRVKNPSSKTFISLQEIVDREGAGVGIENFKDKRTETIPDKPPVVDHPGRLRVRQRSPEEPTRSRHRPKRLRSTRRALALERRQP